MTEHDRKTQLWIRRGERIGQSAILLRGCAHRLAELASRIVRRSQDMAPDHLNRAYPKK